MGALSFLFNNKIKTYPLTPVTDRSVTKQPFVTLLCLYESFYLTCMCTTLNSTILILLKREKKKRDLTLSYHSSRLAVLWLSVPERGPTRDVLSTEATSHREQLIDGADRKHRSPEMTGSLSY